MEKLREVLSVLDEEFAKAPKEKQDQVIKELYGKPEKIRKVLNVLDEEFRKAPEEIKNSVILQLGGFDRPTAGIPTPEKEAVEGSPWIDPVMAASAGFGAGITGGFLRAIGSGLASGVAELPAGMAAEKASDKGHPLAALAFNVGLGAGIEGLLKKIFSRGISKVAPKVAEKAEEKVAEKVIPTETVKDVSEAAKEVPIREPLALPPPKWVMGPDEGFIMKPVIRKPAWQAVYDKGLPKEVIVKKPKTFELTFKKDGTPFTKQGAILYAGRLRKKGIKAVPEKVEEGYAVKVYKDDVVPGQGIKTNAVEAPQTKDLTETKGKPIVEEKKRVEAKIEPQKPRSVSEAVDEFLTEMKPKEEIPVVAEEEIARKLGITHREIKRPEVTFEQFLKQKGVMPPSDPEIVAVLKAIRPDMTSREAGKIRSELKRHEEIRKLYDEYKSLIDKGKIKTITEKVPLDFGKESDRAYIRSLQKRLARKARESVKTKPNEIETPKPKVEPNVEEPWKYKTGSVFDDPDMTPSVDFEKISKEIGKFFRGVKINEHPTNLSFNPVLADLTRHSRREFLNKNLEAAKDFIRLVIRKAENTTSFSDKEKIIKQISSIKKKIALNEKIARDVGSFADDELKRLVKQLDAIKNKLQNEIDSEIKKVKEIINKYEKQLKHPNPKIRFFSEKDIEIKLPSGDKKTIEAPGLFIDKPYTKAISHKNILGEGIFITKSGNYSDGRFLFLKDKVSKKFFDLWEKYAKPLETNPDDTKILEKINSPGEKLHYRFSVEQKHNHIDVYTDKKGNITLLSGKYARYFKQVFGKNVEFYRVSPDIVVVKKKGDPIGLLATIKDSSGAFKGLDLSLLGEQGGFISPQLASHIAGAGVGALTGASMADDEQSRWKAAIAGAIAGAGGSVAAWKAAEKFLQGNIKPEEVKEVFNNLRKELTKNNVVGNQDMKFFWKAFGMPWWWAKKYPEFKPLVEITDRRIKNRMQEIWRLGHLDGIGVLDDNGKNIIRKFNKKQINVLRKALLEGDKHPEKLSKVTKTFTRADGSKVTIKNSWRFTDEQLREMGADDAVIDAYHRIRNMFDMALIDMWKFIKENRERLGIDDDTFQKMRMEFGRLKGYFPHIWPAKNWYILVKDANGDVIHREVASTLVEAKVKRAWLQTKFKGYQVGDIKFNPDFPEEVSFNLGAINLGSMVDSLIKEGKIKPVEGRSLLEALAKEFKARGFGRHFIGRKEKYITGFETKDIEGIINSYLSGWAGYKTKLLSAFEYADALRKINVKQKPNLYAQAHQYVQDMLKNPTMYDRIGGKVRGAIFAYYLAGVPKAAVVNLTQNFVTTIPVLSAKIKRLGLKGNSFAIVNKAAKDILTKSLNTEEKGAIKRAVQSGIFLDKMTREMMGRTPGAFKSYWNQLWNLLAVGFSKAEEFNRMTAFLSAYRVYRKAGKSVDEAIKLAEDFVNDTQFVYGKENLPGWLRNPVGRTAVALKSYSMNLLNLWAHLLSEKEYMALLKSLGAIGVLAGATGLPLVDFAMDQLRSRWGIDIKKNIKDALGETPSAVFLYGIPHLVGVDFSGSLQVDIPFTHLKTPWDWAGQFGGPAVGIARNVWYGLDQAQIGDFYRALEIMAPNFIKNPMKAYRVYKEGAETLSGIDIQDYLKERPEKFKYTNGEAIAKAAGFVPAREKQLRELVNDYRGVKEFLDRKKRIILRKIRKGIPYKEDLIEYNKLAKKYRFKPLTASTIRRELRRKYAPDKAILRYRGE